MKYIGMPMMMWRLFAKSFRNQLTVVFDYDSDTAKAITQKAKPKYKEIIKKIPDFEKADRFKMNIVNCAMIGAFILSMPERPDVERLTDYYAKSMMTKPMRWFCRKSGKSKFTEKDIAGMKATAKLKAADRNPYSWNMEYYEYPEGRRFKSCSRNHTETNLSFCLGWFFVFLYTILVNVRRKICRHFITYFCRLFFLSRLLL